MNEDWVLLSEKDPERRYRIISVEFEFLASIFGGGVREASPMEPVPDLRIVGGRFSSWRGTAELLVTSETFEPVPASEIEPRWAPAFRRVHIETAVAS